MLWYRSHTIKWTDARTLQRPPRSIGSALDQARAAAGDKNVAVGGGADVVQQYLGAGLLDELEIHLVPLLLGDGVRLFGNLGTSRVGLERIRVIESPTGVTISSTALGIDGSSWAGRCSSLSCDRPGSAHRPAKKRGPGFPRVEGRQRHMADTLLCFEPANHAGAS
jgi:RibD C-terminal domain